MSIFLAAAALLAGQDIYLSRADTAQLSEICAENSTSSLNADYCSGYVLGVYDSLSLAGIICPGPGSSSQQALAIARKYLPEHPELWSRHPSWVLKQAFVTVFPCK